MTLRGHAFLDQASVTAAAILAGRHGYFARSVDGPGFEDLLESVHLATPAITGEGQFDLVARTAAGQLDPGFYVAQWLGKHRPTIIHHHGSCERPYNFRPWSRNSFRAIFLAAQPLPQANLIVVRSPFHTLPRLLYYRAMGDLTAFNAMLAASVRLTENLIAYLRERGHERILLSGISLGGWVANRHRAHFNSADVYLPMLAGTELGEIFFEGVYKRMTGRAARSDPDAVRRALNFKDEFLRVPDNNVFPLLARFDRIVPLERHRRGYGGRTVEVLERGHVTALRSAPRLRTFILKHGVP